MTPPFDIEFIPLGDLVHGSAEPIVHGQVFLAVTGEAKANADKVDLIY